MSNIKEATARVIIDSQEAESRLRELTSRSRELKKALDEATKNGTATKQMEKDFASVQKELRSYKNEIVAVNHVMKNLGKVPLGDLRKAEQSLKRQVQGLDRSSEAYKHAAERLRRVRAEITHINSELREMKAPSALDKLSYQFGRLQAAIAPVVAILGSFSVAKRAVSEYAKLTDIYASVQKYTGLSADAVEELNIELSKIDTRSSRERLNELAADAGRLGLSTKEAVLDFVLAADIIHTALGEDLGQEAVKEIGKLSELFDTGNGLKGNMLATASAINELGSSSSAAESFILNFTARLAGVGHQAGLSVTEIMGYASALDQDMMQVESSATSVQKVLIDMFNAPGKYAAVAGRSIADFSDLLRTNANEAFLLFLRGLGQAGNLEKMAPILDSLGQDGARVAAGLADLARNWNKVVEAQSVALEAYDSATSVVDEYNTVNNTANASLEKSKKLFRDIVLQLGKELQPAAGKLISSSAVLVKLFSSLVSAIKLFGPSILSSASAFAIYYVAQQRNKIATQLQVLWNGKLLQSFNRLKVALSTNWFGIVITAVSFLIPLLSRLNKQMDQVSLAQKTLSDAESAARQELAETMSRTKENLALLHSETASLQLKQARLEELKRTIPGYTAELSNEGKVLKENRIALDEYIASQEKSILLKHYESKHAELVVEEEKLKDKRIGIKTNIELVKQGKKKPNFKEIYLSSLFHRTAPEGKILLDKYKRELSKTEKDLTEVSQARQNLIKKISTYSDASAIPEINIETGGGAGGGFPAKAKEKKIRDSAEKEALDQFKEKWEKIRLIAQEHYKAGLIQEETYYATERLIDLAAQEDKIALLRALGHSVIDEQKKLNDMRFAEAKRHNKELKEAMKSSLKNVVNKERAEEEEEEPAIKKVAKEDELALRLRHLKESFDKGILAEQEYYDKRKELLNDYVAEATKKEREKVDLALEMTSSLGELVNQVEQAEISSVENRYAAKLKAAKGNKEEEERLTEEMEEEKNNVRKKYADIGFAITAAEIISKTALAVMDVWSKHAANPVAAGVLTGIVSAIGAAQLLTANQQREAIQNLWTGGFTEPGDKYTPRGIVHAGEFVANQDAVRNPALRKLFNVIDFAQRSNTVSRLDDAALSRALHYRIEGIQRDASTIKRRYTLEKIKQKDQRKSERAIQKLSDSIDRGTLAKVVLSGTNGLEEKSKRYNNLQSSIKR